MPFDETKVAAWVDTEGCITIFGTWRYPRSSAVVRVVQKERKPLSEYCLFVSSRFGVRCAVLKRIDGYIVAHVATLEFLDVIEPLIETENKRKQISEARKLYAERGFRLTFLDKGERKRRLGAARGPIRDSRPICVS